MVQPDAFNRFAPPPRSFAFDHSNNRSVVVLGLHMRKCAGTAVRRMFADTGAWGAVPYCPHGGRDTAVRYGRGVAQRQQWGPDADRLLFWVRPNPAPSMLVSARCVELAPSCLRTPALTLTLTSPCRSSTASPSSSISSRRYARRTRCLPRGAHPLPWRPYTYYIHAPCTVRTGYAYQPPACRVYLRRTGLLAPGGALLYVTSCGRAVRMHTVALQVAFVVLRHPVDLLLSEVRLL